MFTLSHGNDMNGIFGFGMRYSHHGSPQYPNRVKSLLTIIKTVIWSSKGIFSKNHLRIGKIQTMLFQVGSPFSLVPSELYR